MFELLILGDRSVGKTSFIDRHITGKFTDNYTPTWDNKIKELYFNTINNSAFFKVYDGCYPTKIDCAIIMFDLSHYYSFENVIYYYNWLKSTYGEIPIVICGNKSDIRKRKVSCQDIGKFLHDTHKNLNLKYFDISSKSNYNYDKPFSVLISELAKKVPIEN